MDKRDQTADKALSNRFHVGKGYEVNDQHHARFNIAQQQLSKLSGIDQTPSRPKHHRSLSNERNAYGRPTLQSSTKLCITHHDSRDKNNSTLPLADDLTLIQPKLVFPLDFLAHGLVQQPVIPHYPRFQVLFLGQVAELLPQLDFCL